MSAILLLYCPKRNYFCYTYASKNSKLVKDLALFNFVPIGNVSGYDLSCDLPSARTTLKAILSKKREMKIMEKVRSGYMIDLELEGTTYRVAYDYFPAENRYPSEPDIDAEVNVITIYKIDEDGEPTSMYDQDDKLRSLAEYKIWKELEKQAEEQEHKAKLQLEIFD